MKHFDAQNIHFDYLSPVNEPQWEWAETKQEGSPWNNREIAAFAKAIDHSFTMNKVRTRILIPEAAKLDFLLSGNGRNQNQIDEFLNPKHPNYVGNLPHLAPVMAGHSYFTDNGNEQIVQTRKAVREKLQAYPPFSYWQSEYCFLGNGYKDGIDKPSAMEVALFLAKIIHTDLVVGNATAWQYWNAIEPTQNLDGIALFYLIAMKPNQSRTDGEFKATKSLYALGQFSRFVRPGMKRLSVARSDQLSDIAAAGKCMISSYVDAASKSLVIIAINLTNHPQALKIKFANCPEKFQVNRLKPYLTTDSPDQNMKALQPFAGGQYSVPARSIVTLVNKLPNVMPEPLNPKV
jgi:O-glycosyl hydrolase